MVFFSYLIEHSVITCENPDQTPLYAMPDLDLHCLHMYHKKDVKLIWVKEKVIWSVSKCYCRFYTEIYEHTD